MFYLMSKTWGGFAQSSEPEAHVKTLDKLKIQDKMKCGLCVYKY